MFQGDSKQGKTSTGSRMVHQPILDGRFRNRHNSAEEHGHLVNAVPQMETAHNFLLPLTKRDFYSKKDTARKNLLGYLYTRQPVLHRSYSFIAGEKPVNEPGLPKIASFSREKTIVDPNKSRSRSYDLTHQDLNMSHAKLGKVREFLKSGSSRSNQTIGIDDRSPQRSRTNSNRLVFPGITEDVNNNEKYADDTYSDEGSNGRPKKRDEVITFVPSRLLGNELKATPSKYRPITPNMLKKLDRLKLPSRIRTKEWIDMLPSDSRAYIGESRINAQYVPEDLYE